MSIIQILAPAYVGANDLFDVTVQGTGFTANTQIEIDLFQRVGPMPHLNPPNVTVTSTPNGNVFATFSALHLGVVGTVGWLCQAMDGGTIVSVSYANTVVT